MEIFFPIITFLIGLSLLILGANWFIQSSVKFAHLLRLSSVFIGLILVAFGTSAPEAGVGILAAVKNESAIALGNIVGSNIANIGLILGLCALFVNLPVERSLLRRETPFMLTVTGLLYLFIADHLIQRWEGMVFILLFIGFCYVSWRAARTAVLGEDIAHFQFSRPIQALRSRGLISLVLIGSLGLIGWGSHLMVESGVTIARMIGISPWIIGMTMFAVGTSLPELAASLTASFKKVPNISVGNIVGSNIFNIIFVLGIVSVINPLRIDPAIMRFEMPALVFFSILLFTVMKTKDKITRNEGVLLLGFYVSFIALLTIRQ